MSSGLPGCSWVFMRLFTYSVNKGKPTLSTDTPILKRPGQRKVTFRCGDVSFSKITHQMKLLTFLTYKAYGFPVAVCTDFLNASSDAIV